MKPREYPKWTHQCPNDHSSVTARLECREVDCEFDGEKCTETEKVPWLQQGIPIPFDDVNELYTEIHRYICDHVDFIEEPIYDVIACWILLSYRFQEFDVCPYLFMLGPKASGKTRVLEVLQQLANKGILTANISPAALYRAVEEWEPTLLLDEAETYRNEGKIEVQNLLNAGYRRDQTVIRVEKIKDGLLTLGCFNVYGPKAIAGTTTLLPTLQSRSITIFMEKATRQILIWLDREKTKKLRSKLLFYKDNHDGCQDFDEKQLEELKDGRLIELFTPLIKVAPSKEVAEKILGYAKKTAGVQLEEEGASEEALALKTVLDSIEEPEGFEKTTLSIQELTEKFNVGVLERDQIKARKMGGILKRLGFNKTRIAGSGRTAVIVEANRLCRLIYRYMPGEFEKYEELESRHLEYLHNVHGAIEDVENTVPETAKMSLKQPEKTENGVFSEQSEKGGKREDREGCEDKSGPSPTSSKPKFFECNRCKFKAFSQNDLTEHKRTH